MNKPFTSFQKKTTILFLIFSISLLFVFTSCGNRSAGAEEAASAGGKTVTFIELGSVNCIPCVAMQPVMEKVRTELGDQVDVVFYDVWTEEGQPFGRKYGIRLIPTQIFLDSEGKEYFRHEGFFPAEELYKVLEYGGVKL